MRKQTARLAFQLRSTYHTVRHPATATAVRTRVTLKDSELGKVSKIQRPHIVPRRRLSVGAWLRPPYDIRRRLLSSCHRRYVASYTDARNGVQSRHRRAGVLGVLHRIFPNSPLAAHLNTTPAVLSCSTVEVSGQNLFVHVQT